MVKSVVTCEDSTGVSCHGNMESKFFSLDVSETTEKLIIIAKGVTFDQELPINITFDSSGVNLNLYAQYGAIPKKTLHDYSSDISKVPLVIPSPKVGTWYFTIQPVYPSHVSGEMEEKDIKVCYLMKGQVYDCLDGKGGPNCTWEKYVLKAFPRANPTVPYIFLPERYKNLSLGSPNFHLEPFLSKSSNGNKSGFAWTFFSLDIPQGEAGKNIHIQLIAERKIDYELYARFGGSPSLDIWDYCYINKTGISKNSSMLKVYTSGEKITDFYIFYAREGPWGFGLRYPIHMTSDSHPHTTMSISIKSCPNHCSGHGTCQSEQDASGSTYYSYCQCDRTHGGFDCSVELVSREGFMQRRLLFVHKNRQRWHSISLIASNAAAILPAFWALRQKAFADWVIFMFSGVSSGLYHACDVGSWCALKFHVLQFMDFWLSFMAVASTFVYLAFISEAAKRAIHTTVSILTAILAVTGATRSSNIFLVVAIGALGLLVGWLIEFFSTFKSSSFSLGSSLNNLKRWKNIKAWLIKLIKTLYKRFRWGFVLMGFIALSMAAISWTMENSQSYWIWHSVWHVSIYTSSFFFLCSKVMTLNGESRAVLNTEYELTLT